MKIVVTGGRDYEDWAMVQEVLDRLNPSHVYVGDCPTGADEMARAWCDNNKVNYTIFVANWDKFKKAAGPLRNAEMLGKAGHEATVLAFPGGKGTDNCVKTAIQKNMIILRVEA